MPMDLKSLLWLDGVASYGRSKSARLNLAHLWPDIPFPEKLRMADEVYHTLGATVARYNSVSSNNVGDGGGFTPGSNWARCSTGN